MYVSPGTTPSVGLGKLLTGAAGFAMVHRGELYIGAPLVSSVFPFAL